VLVRVRCPRMGVGGLHDHGETTAHPVRGGRPAAGTIVHRSTGCVTAVTVVLTYLTVLAVTGVGALRGVTAASAVAVLGGLLVAARMWARRTHHHPAPPVPDLGPEKSARDSEHRLPSTGVAPDALDALSTPQLCLAWRSSYLRLHRATSGPATAHIVLVRQRMLDELERRDRAGFERWLSTGARAASDLSRYIGHPT